MEFLSKRRLFGAFCILGVLFLVTLFLDACDDFGLDDDTALDENFFSSVRGEIHIDGVPPEETDELLLILMGEGLSPRFTRSIPRNALNMDIAKQEVSFIIEAQPRGETAKFEGLFAIWKERGHELDVFPNIIGTLCEEGTLIPIEMTEETSIVDSVSIAVNLKKVNRTGRMTGVVDFQGEWPDDIENLGVVFADSILVTSLIESFISTGQIEIDVCNFLQHSDIRFIEARNVDSLNVDFEVAAGLNLMVVAMNKTGQSVFEPTILTKTDINNLLASGFIAIADSTISGIRSVAQFQ